MIRASVELDLSKLDYVRGSGMNKAIRMGFNKAMVPVKDAVIKNAPADKGSLKKSIKIKVKYYKSSKTWAGIAGPSAKFKRSGGKIKRGKNKGQKRTIRPARYAHVVNWGSRKMKGRKFLEASMSSTKAKFANDLAQFIKDKLAEQLNKK
jgi:HK97 gp10 family phage protein